MHACSAPCAKAKSPSKLVLGAVANESDYIGDFAEAAPPEKPRVG